MFEHKTLDRLDRYFEDLNTRKQKIVYFFRINGYNRIIDEFIQHYFDAARKTGVVIEGRIPNPDENNLSYYNEIMGITYAHRRDFIENALRKWLPRMNDYQRGNVAEAMFDVLERMRLEGKNENMLKNAYIKFMCWLYYKFERIISQLGNTVVPKILYEGDISNYELKLMSVLSRAGCDIVLLQYHGDSGYLKLDAASSASMVLSIPEMAAFPENFSLKTVRQAMTQQAEIQRLYGNLPAVSACTNAWITGEGLKDILCELKSRGNDSALYYNCFCRISGVEDKVTYQNDLYQFHLQLKASGRHVVIAENSLTAPTMEEIAQIRRNNYSSVQQMLMELTANIHYTASSTLRQLMVKAFIDIMMEESSGEGGNLHRLTNKAVYLLCWLSRYQKQLFVNWKMPEISCFIYLGGCRNENEALFCRMLARLPVDVLILVPDLNVSCCLKDTQLYEKREAMSLAVTAFPSEQSEIAMGTAAYHAERELDTVMYQDSGMYRNQQYQQAMSVTLRTMYEEISILWNQELKYRPNFSVLHETVNLPVIFSKVSGVKDGQVSAYWASVKSLLTQDTLCISSVPFIQPTDENPVKPYVTEFYKNGRLRKDLIKEHSAYQYGYLREEMQDYILEKLHLLIDRKLIRGTFENGTEYTIIAVVLNLDKGILRLIQKFDFTKVNPKIVYINTGEKMISLEDSIMLAFLNLVGFDIVFFIPTGYQNVEKYFNQKVMEEHQLGEYMYDLQPPDFNRLTAGTQKLSWRDKIFKRGN